MIRENLKRLLVVNQDIEVCNFVKMFFEQRGFQVYRAHDIREAIQIAQAETPEVILLDVPSHLLEEAMTSLPKITDIVPESKVLITATVHDDVSIMRAKSLGAARLISKPLVLEDLEEAIIRCSNEA